LVRDSRTPIHRVADSIRALGNIDFHSAIREFPTIPTRRFIDSMKGLRQFEFLVRDSRIPIHRVADSIRAFGNTDSRSAIREFPTIPISRITDSIRAPGNTDSRSAIREFPKISNRRFNERADSMKGLRQFEFLVRDSRIPIHRVADSIRALGNTDFHSAIREFPTIPTRRFIDSVKGLGNSSSRSAIREFLTIPIS